MRYQYLIFRQSTIHSPDGRPQPSQYRRELFLPLVVDFVQPFLYCVCPSSRPPTTPDVTFSPHAAASAAWFAADGGVVITVFVGRLFLVSFRLTVVCFGIFIFVVANVAIEGLNGETEVFFTDSSTGAAARGEARPTLRMCNVLACGPSSLAVRWAEAEIRWTPA